MTPTPKTPYDRVKEALDKIANEGGPDFDADDMVYAASHALPALEEMRQEMGGPRFPIPVQVKADWYDAKKKGEQVGPAVFVQQWWVPVLWPDDEDPDFFKAAGLDGAIVPEDSPNV